MDLLKELSEFLDGLKKYREILTNPDSKLLEDKRKHELSGGASFLQEYFPKKGKDEIREELIEELRQELVRKVGQYKNTIFKLTGKITRTQFGRTYEVWSEGLRRGGHLPSVLLELDSCIDATNEAIGKLEKEEASRIAELFEKPPKAIKQRSKDMAESPLSIFDAMHFHPKVVETSRQLFKDGHYRDAIYRAFVEVNNFVKDKSNNERDGKKLMSTVFSLDNPIIKLNYLKTQSDRDEQEGFMFLFMGAMEGIRNPKAHENIIQNDPYRTLEYLGLASLLLKIAEAGELVEKEPK